MKKTSITSVSSIAAYSLIAFLVYVKKIAPAGPFFQSVSNNWFIGLLTYDFVYLPLLKFFIKIKEHVNVWLKVLAVLMNLTFIHKSRIYPKVLKDNLTIPDSKKKKNKSVRVDQKQMIYYSKKYAKKQRMDLRD